jgi:prepilin-type N-terminal cleavage/methylation domain-containing protein
MHKLSSSIGPRSQQGFTLVELMIVIVILGVLVTIAIPNMIGMQDRARVASVKANGRALQITVESFQIDRNRYPSTIQDLTTHEAYKVLQNPFTRAEGVAGADGMGAWRTNDNGAVGGGRLGATYDDALLSKGLAIYVGLDAEGRATTRFLGNGQNSTRPTVSYMIYACDRGGYPVRKFLLSPGDAPTPEAQRLLSGR